MMDCFVIKKDSERYPGIERSMPESFAVSGVTKEQAEEMAERLLNRNAGCDYSWYVVGGDEG